MDDADGALAVRIARDAVEREASGRDPPEPPSGGDFSEPAGAFVTLRTFPDGYLRGCIGFCYPVMPLGAALVQAAMEACHDPRFPPLSASETGRVTVEVTVLTPPEVMEGTPEEILSSIEVGRDGLMISLRGRSGLLLPQVPVEQGWNVMDYMRGLCMKAGLGPDSWRDPAARISAFRGEIFSESAPGKEPSRRRSRVRSSREGDRLR